jgi:predicted nucleic acid-binding protein
MKAVFADTFFLIAFTNTQDIAHESAKDYTRSAMLGTICTTEEVLTEYLNYFSGWGTRFRQKAAQNVRNILDNPSVRIVPQTSKSFLNGYALYCARFDKGYSLTDCISMETMRGAGITEVLTNDAHFEQEGFRALLRAR